MDGTVKKYKARLVALGYGQVSSEDVFKTICTRCNECDRAIVVSHSLYHEQSYTSTRYLKCC